MNRPSIGFNRHSSWDSLQAEPQKEFGGLLINPHKDRQLDAAIVSHISISTPWEYSGGFYSGKASLSEKIKKND